MIGIPQRAQLPETTKDALTDTWAQMEEIFLAEHDEDGKHTTITADSVTTDMLTADDAVIDHLRITDEIQFATVDTDTNVLVGRETLTNPSLSIKGAIVPRAPLTYSMGEINRVFTAVWAIVESISVSGG